MAINRTLDQQIAVFGESGSGKTVLLSSFYGPAQELEFENRESFSINSDDTGQGNLLHQKYLGMRDDGVRPQPDKFRNSSYSFRVQIKSSGNEKSKQGQPFDGLRLIWHDYPGEWFEQNPTSAEEAERRVDTFRSLMQSDVAFVLVDGQKLVDYPGEEAKYLKALFTSFNNGLLNLRERILNDGKKLDQFPRIWIIALSKADLLPALNVESFRQLIVKNAAGEVQRFKDTIASFVNATEYLSVGSDFMLLSSAAFTPERIDLTRTIGVDLVLPIASLMPFERRVQWNGMHENLGKVGERVIAAGAPAAIAIATILLNRKWAVPGPIAAVQSLLASVLSKEMLEKAFSQAQNKVQEANDSARKKKLYLREVITGFKLKLDRAEEELELRRSSS